MVAQLGLSSMTRSASSFASSQRPLSSVNATVAMVAPEAMPLAPGMAAAVLAEIAAMNAKIDALGLIFDSDPRRVTKTGVYKWALQLQRWGFREIDQKFLMPQANEISAR